MNALLDYGTSSDSDENSNDSSSSKGEPPASSKPKLPKPSLGENLQTSVFSNPFVAAERAKAAILEKHVKMVPGKEDTQMINGRKICWNYRKGRCRFGHKCRYAHDSDVQKTPEELLYDEKNEKKLNNTVVCEGVGTMSSGVPPAVEILSPTDDAVWEGGSEKKSLKRPGLSQTLVPGKKVIKMYKEQKSRNSIKK